MNGKSFLAILVFAGCSAFSEAQQPADSVAVPSINKKILTSAILTESSIYVAGMSFLQFVWYKDKERVPFEYYNDSKGYLQIDKCGHAFAAYG